MITAVRILRQRLVKDSWFTICVQSHPVILPIHSPIKTGSITKHSSPELSSAHFLFMMMKVDMFFNLLSLCILHNLLFDNLLHGYNVFWLNSLRLSSQHQSSPFPSPLCVLFFKPTESTYFCRYAQAQRGMHWSRASLPETTSEENWFSLW